MPPTDEPQDDLSVTRQKSWAAGVPGVRHALQYALGQASTRRTALTARDLNHVEGIGCPSCAWPELGQGIIVRLEPVAGGGG